MRERTKILRRLAELAKTLDGEELPIHPRKIAIDLSTFMAIQKCGFALIELDTKEHDND